MKKIILLTTLYLVCSSCARMVVKVETADLKMVQKEYDTLIKTQISIKALLEKEEIKKELKKSKEKFSSLTGSALKKSKKEGDINKLASKINFTYTQALIENKALNYYNLSKSYKKLINEYSTFENLVENTDTDNKEAVKNQKEELKRQSEKVEKVKELRERDQKRNLLGDLLTSYVTSDTAKNADLWKSNYNEAKSTTGFGNADIAVVLMEDADSYNNNYSIKGVRVDADKLIQSSFDILAQSITLLASTTGVVPQGGGDEDNYFAPTEIPQIQQLATNKIELRKKQEQLKAYKQLIILDILSRNLDGKNKDDTKKAIKDINAIWTSYKSKLGIK